MLPKNLQMCLEVGADRRGFSEDICKLGRFRSLHLHLAVPSRGSMIVIIIISTMQILQYLSTLKRLRLEI